MGDKKKKNIINILLLGFMILILVKANMNVSGSAPGIFIDVSILLYLFNIIIFSGLYFSLYNLINNKGKNKGLNIFFLFLFLIFAYEPLMGIVHKEMLDYENQQKINLINDDMQNNPLNYIRFYSFYAFTNEMKIRDDVTYIGLNKSDINKTKFLLDTYLEPYSGSSDLKIKFYSIEIYEDSKLLCNSKNNFIQFQKNPREINIQMNCNENISFLNSTPTYNYDIKKHQIIKEKAEIKIQTNFGNKTYILNKENFYVVNDRRANKKSKSINNSMAMEIVDGMSDEELNKVFHKK